MIRKLMALAGLVVALEACAGPPPPTYSADAFKGIFNQNSASVPANAPATMTPPVGIIFSENVETYLGYIKNAGEYWDSVVPTSLKNQIKTQLADYVKSTPGTELVTIAVKAWRSYKFTIQGEISRPGVYSSEGFVTVADAIAMAGGLTRFAGKSGIKIFRTDPATKKVRQIPVDYGQITSGKRLDMNIWVLAGDVISIP